MGASCSSEESQGEQNSYTSAGEDDGQNMTQANLTINPVHKGPILDLDFNERTRRMVTCSDDKRLCLVDWEMEMNTENESSQTQRRYLDGHSKAVNRIDVNQSTGHIWSVSRDLSLRCWDSETGSCLQIIEETHELNVSAVASILSGDRVYTGSRDYHVKGWDVETGKNVCDFSTPRNIVTAMTFGRIDNTNNEQSGADTGNMLLQASEDLSIKVWDVRVGSKNPVIRIGGFVYFALSLDTAIDGALLAAGCKGFNGVGCDVKLWDIRNFSQPIGECSEHEQDVTSVRFISQGLLSSCSKDGTVRLWDAQSNGLKSIAQYTSGNKYTSLCRSTLNCNEFAAGTFEGHLELLSVNAESGTVECKHVLMGQDYS